MELQGGGMNEMSTMQTSGNGSPGGQEQPSDYAM